MANRRKNYDGVVFGYLTALHEVSERSKEGRRQWLCRCICGNEVVKDVKTLTEGSCKSCGCMRQRLRLESSGTIKHNMSNSRLYRIWSSMKNRCKCETSDVYKDYGGRGIKVCEGWNEFEPFFKWATENGYDETLTIDRIDVNGDYEPENCRWVDRSVQANNKRTSRFLTYDGLTLTLSQWAKRTGIGKETLKDRANAGWPVEEIITTPAVPGGILRHKHGR